MISVFSKLKILECDIAMSWHGSSGLEMVPTGIFMVVNSIIRASRMDTSSVFHMVLELVLQFSLKEHFIIKYPNYLNFIMLKIQKHLRKNLLMLSKYAKCSLPILLLCINSKRKDYNRLLKLYFVFKINFGLNPKDFSHKGRKRKKVY